MAEIKAKRWMYVKRPEARVGPEHYKLEDVTIKADLNSDEVLIEVVYWSVDPYMRIQQAERDSYDKPHPLNSIQQGGTVGVILASNSPRFVKGDHVVSYHGWQTHVRCHHSEIQKINVDIAPLSTALGVLGMPGRTAWFGLMEAGRPRPGEVLLVSGALGAVGSLVVQFGKLAGCKVIGIAGGREKCQRLIETFKCDGAIDYKAFESVESLRAEIDRLTGGGFDIYFDNVGGKVTDAALPLMKLRARIVICGAIAQYDGGLDHPDLAPRFLQHLIFKRATIQGILARDFTHRMDELRSMVGPWVKQGKITFDETVIDGFEQLPEALGMLFEGKNVGKLLVKK